MGGIKVNVGANTSDFQRGLDRLAAQTDKFKQSLGKKLSVANIGNTVLGALGIGSVAAVASKIVELYRNAADRAKDLEESTARALDNTLRAIGLRQSPLQRADSLRKQAGDLGTQIGMAKGTLDSLENDPRRLLDAFGGFEYAIQQARDGLKGLQEQQAGLLYQADALEFAEKQKLNSLRDQRMALEDNIDVEKGEMTALQAANRELQRMEWLRNRIAGGMEKGKGPTDLEQVNLDILKQRAVVEGLKASERQALFDYSSAPKAQSQLVADSLAKVGGGGRVGVSNTQLSEAKKTNRILANIEAALKDSRAGLLR